MVTHQNVTIGPWLPGFRQAAILPPCQICFWSFPPNVCWFFNQFHLAHLCSVYLTGLSALTYAESLQPVVWDVFCMPGFRTLDAGFWTQPFFLLLVEAGVCESFCLWKLCLCNTAHVSPSELFIRREAPCGRGRVTGCNSCLIAWHHHLGSTHLHHNYHPVLYRQPLPTNLHLSSTLIYVLHKGHSLTCFCSASRAYQPGGAHQLKSRTESRAGLLVWPKELTFCISCYCLLSVWCP